MIRSRLVNFFQKNINLLDVHFAMKLWNFFYL